MLKIAVNGAAGRMGGAVVELLAGWGEAVLAAAFEQPGHPTLGREVAPGVALSVAAVGALATVDAVIDSTPRAARECLAMCVAAGKPLVIGTTGFGEADMALVAGAARTIPVLCSPNMSLGVNVLFRLVGQAARFLPGYQAEIIELHHDRKVDAPSGTALKLGETVAAARGRKLAEVAVHGRRGAVGPRSAGEIGFHAVRLADVIGEHTVIFAAAGERIELTHKAGTRHNLAAGALEAAVFLAGRAPGLYAMDDLLDRAGGDKV